MKNILITVRPWEKRITIVENKLLQNIYFDSRSSYSLERSFFKGRIAKVLPGVQTAFVDIGQQKAGFLHISEIDRDLAFKQIYGGEEEDIDQNDNNETQKSFSRTNEIRNGRDDININDILTQGEHILVQVSKEPINDKGPKLTTCFTIPGRFIVLMPNIPKIGISKRILQADERKRLKDIVTSFLPESAGCIIRTTSENRSEEEIKQDLYHLLEVWDTIQKKFITAESQECIFRDIDLTLQIIRDHLDNNVEFVLCDNEELYKKITAFVKSVSPEFLHKIIFYKEMSPLFDMYSVEDQIQQALQPRVNLPSGGSIIIDSTEAMTVIDVNTARYTGTTKPEDTILKTNLEAASEIVRQLKLRNIGGLVVIDFIDLATPFNRNKLFSFFEKTLREEDKSQSVVLKISEFGLVQMTRKRTGKTLHQQLLHKCILCHGAGITKSVATRAYEMCRALEKIFISKIQNKITHCMITAEPELASYLINNEYDSLLFLEKKYTINIVIKSDENLTVFYTFDFSVNTNEKE